jgi:hypothetical protein
MRERRPEPDVRGVEQEDAETAEELPHLVTEERRIVVVRTSLQQAHDDESYEHDERNDRRHRSSIGRIAGLLDPLSVRDR